MSIPNTKSAKKLVNIKKLEKSDTNFWKASCNPSNLFQFLIVQSKLPRTRNFNGIFKTHENVVLGI